MPISDRQLFSGCKFTVFLRFRNYIEEKKDIEIMYIYVTILSFPLLTF